MADAREHAATVLSAILPARKDLLEVALLRLTAEHFPDKVQQNLFLMLERYCDHTGTVMPLKHLDDALRRSAHAVGQAELYVETYAQYAETPVTDADFTWSVEQLRDLAAERITGEAITESMTILRTGRTGEDGEIERGHAAAREHLLQALSVIDREVTMQEAPEGSLRDENDDILADYAERKQAHADGTSLGIGFGITALDAKVGGMQPGELVLLAGYSSDGKSSLAVQAAWSAATEQGKNVLFLTTETLRAQIRRKIVSRHSKQPMFALPDGLNSRDLKSGTLTPDQEISLHQVVGDLTNNPDYGQIYVAQVPRGATIASIEQRMYRVQRKMHIDFVVMDYLALLASANKRVTSREELASIVKEAKQVSTTFDGGRGVPFCSPWQVTRAARENAEKIGMYTSASMSETAEATNSADLIVSLLAPTDNTNRHAEVTMQILKARDGETVNNLIVAVDYATSCFASRVGLQFAPTATSNGFTGGLDSLLH